MKKTTIIGCFLGLLSLTLSAQTTQPSNSKTSSSPTNIEVQNDSQATSGKLLTRDSYQQSARAANDEVVVFNSSAEARNITVSEENRAAHSQTPLFVAPRMLTAEDEAEISAAKAEGVYSDANAFSIQNGVVQNRILSDIVPTAGATESFAAATGDFFYDPSDGVNGGPGGDCSTTSSGDPGDYPNCGCTTVTTLTGSDLSVEFLSFRVFGDFDYLNIYDGTDVSAPKIYDSNLNTDTDTLDGMIAANGSGVFNSTSGALTFEFKATAVVNTCGWEVEVLSGGGGGSSAYCIPEGTNSDRFIDNFSTTGGSENISNMGSGFSTGGYGDFYDTATVTQEQEGTVDFSADMEGGTAGFRVWVDWNQDGVFDTTAEVAYASSGYLSNQTGTITVPADALEGDTRMRVVSHWLSTTGDVDPCETGFTYGEFEDYKFTVTAGGGGGGSGPCAQEHPIAGDGNGGSGSSVDSDFTSAADIVVAAGEDFTLDTIEVSFLTFAPEDAPITANVIYYEDAAGLPGAEIGTETVVPTILSSGEWVNPVAFRFDTSLDMTPFTFNGDAGSDTSYWIGIEMGTATNQATVFWLYTDGAGIEGEPMAQYNAVDGFWTVPEPTREVGYVFSGECETIGGGGSFPDPYCGPLEFGNGVEPITLVDVAGISNVSDATVGGSPAHEDFTAIEGDMEEGMTYAIALEGNTDGGFTNSFTVFIDWNQDGILDNDSERYEIGTIVGSTGTDGQQATGDIVVPSGVTAGQTRMRVIKRYTDNYATDSCTPGSGYGQAEDYTINVTGGGGTGGDCEQEHPIAGDGNGGSGSSVDSDFTSAADIVVAAGEDFTLDTIEVSFLTFAPEDAPITANVIYYEDAAGLPGAEIGTETVVPTILSSGEWVNPVAFRFDTSLDMTPFTFSGDAGSDTSYWIGIEMGTATNQATVFWLYTDGAGIEGEPMAQYNAVDGFWTVPEPTREVGYVFSGECSPLSIADNTLDGFTFYPNPTSGSLSLSSVNTIDSVSIFNLLGQKVMDVNIEATASEVNLSGLTAGTYIMHVSVEGQIGTYKVMKN